MKETGWRFWTKVLLLLLGSTVMTARARAQSGIVLSGAGPINRSVGGTATGMPLDSMGALLWNPATLSGLEHSELGFGTEILLVNTQVSSGIQASAFGPGTPPVPLAGSTGSDTGTTLLGDIGLVQKCPDSPWAFGLGVLTVGGFSTNYPASFTNPILTPAPPVGLGLGNALAELQVLQLTPAVSVQLTDHLSVGISPLIDLALLRIGRFPFAPPDDANGDGFPSRPDGTHTHLHYGGGFHIGAYYTTDMGLNFGMGLRSKQWFEKFQYNSTDELGRPRALDLRFEFPLIASIGASYTGMENWVFGYDVRYINYRDAKPFDAKGFAPDGSLRGLGWKDLFVVTAGAQYRMSERISVRAGYSYNNSTQDGDVAFFNVGAPTILQHGGYAGLSYHVNDHLIASLAYAHAFKAAVEGPFVLPFGPVPGTAVRSTASADAFVLGFTVRY